MVVLLVVIALLEYFDLLLWKKWSGQNQTSQCIVNSCVLKCNSHAAPPAPCISKTLYHIKINHLGTVVYKGWDLQPIYQLKSTTQLLGVGYLCIITLSLLFEDWLSKNHFWQTMKSSLCFKNWRKEKKFHWTPTVSYIRCSGSSILLYV